MMKSDRTHFLMKNGRLRRESNNIYFDIFDEDENVVKKKVIPINGVDEIYILGKVLIDSYTIAFLSNHNILLHFFSQYQGFRGNFFPSSPNSVNKSGFVLLAQLRAFDDEKKRVYIAKQITKGHILNAVKNCKKYGIKFETEEIIEDLENAEDISNIMALEGNFKKKYYQKWNEIIKNQKSFKFTKGTKRPPTDKLNSFISYMNVRIYNVTLSEIYKTELDPRIGFLHEPNYRSLSLHLDISEIFKPIIADSLIFEMLNKKEITAKDFETSYGRIRFRKSAIKTIELKMINRLTTQITIGEQKLTWRQVIRREVNRVKRFIVEGSEYEPFVY